MENEKVYIYHPGTKSYGIMVIIDRIKEACEKLGVDCLFVNQLDGLKANDFIIPYGSTPALQLLDRGLTPIFVMLVDAYTLGELNKVKFYFKNKLFYKYDFFYSIYAYFKTIKEEKKVLHNYKNVMLVSDVDVDYLKGFAPKDVNFICVRNGVSLPLLKEHNPSEKLRLGILSSFGSKTSFEENDWFVCKYYRKYIREHKNVELHIAGRGAYGKVYERRNQIKYWGAVEDLNDFFSNIDVFLVVNPKGCGILNRALDGFSHKVPVLGYQAAFSGFRYMNDSYLEFSSYESFENQLDFIINNPDHIAKMVDNAYEQIQKYNDWDKNYTKLASFIKTLKNKIND